MKRLLTVSVIVAGLSLITSTSEAGSPHQGRHDSHSGYGSHGNHGGYNSHGGYNNHSRHGSHGGHHGHGGHSLGTYGYGSAQQYRQYGYGSSYGNQSYRSGNRNGHQPRFQGGYSTGYRSQRQRQYGGLHIDVGRLHIGLRSHR